MNWSSRAKLASSEGNSTHIGRITGIPLRWDSANSVYHSGSRE